MSNEPGVYLTQSSIKAMAEDPLTGISGVTFKILRTHGDDRGFFREVIRENDPVFVQGHFGQWSHSFMQRNVVKAWHYHHLQYDWWYLALGQAETALIDFREESPTFKKKLLFKMGDSAEFGADTLDICIGIPPGVLHGCRVLSDSAHLFYITSRTYDPGDEGRYPFNSSEVDHDWGDDAIVVDNDRRRIVPAYPREMLPPTR